MNHYKSKKNRTTIAKEIKNIYKCMGSSRGDWSRELFWHFVVNLQQSYTSKVVFNTKRLKLTENNVKLQTEHLNYN